MSIFIPSVDIGFQNAQERYVAEAREVCWKLNRNPDQPIRRENTEGFSFSETVPMWVTVAIDMYYDDLIHGRLE